MPKFPQSSPIAPSECLWHVENVATYLKKSQRTVERYVAIRKIPHIAFGPGERKSVRFRKSAIDQWLLDESNGNRVCDGRTTTLPTTEASL